MAEKKKKNSAATEGTEGTEGKAPKLDRKKLIIVLAAMAVVIVIALIGDIQVNRRPVLGYDDAFNRLLAAGVLSNNPEIEYETSVDTENLEPEEINGKVYYPIKIVINYDTPEAKTLPMFYVLQSNGDVFQDDGTGKLVPWGV